MARHGLLLPGGVRPLALWGDGGADMLVTKVPPSVAGMPEL